MRSPEPEQSDGNVVDDANRRDYRRLPQHQLECNYGPVLDLSGSGMRVISKKALEGTITVLLSGKGIDQKLKARVTRCKKVGFRVYEVALQFVDVKQMRAVVEWIAFWSAPPTKI